MEEMFKLIGRFFLAVFKITSYFFAFLFQSIWYAAHRQWEKIGEAMVNLGYGIVDSIKGIFK